MTKFAPGTIQTYSGAEYNFEAPTWDSVRLDDIAHALSNMCRFAGHVKRFYSVAEHCVRVSWILEAWGEPRAVQADGQLHDGHEAYVWDCPRPLKSLLGENFEELAASADTIIATKFRNGQSGEIFHRPSIKRADDCALVAEAQELMHHGPEHWDAWGDRYSKVEAPPFNTMTHLGWGPEYAERVFKERCRELDLYRPELITTTAMPDLVLC